MWMEFKIWDVGNVLINTDKLAKITPDMNDESHTLLFSTDLDAGYAGYVIIDETYKSVRSRIFKEQEKTLSVTTTPAERKTF